MRDSLETLKELQRAVNAVIEAYDETPMVPMTDKERFENLKKYGEHDFIVGNFLISVIGQPPHIAFGYEMNPKREIDTYPIPK